MKSLKIFCSADGCIKRADYERSIKDLDTDRSYRIYLCPLHKDEFDSYHVIMRISK
jgi:hypothetical protein